MEGAAIPTSKVVAVEQVPLLGFVAGAVYTPCRRETRDGTGGTQGRRARHDNAGGGLRPRGDLEQADGGNRRPAEDGGTRARTLSYRFVPSHTGSGDRDSRSAGDVPQLPGGPTCGRNIGKADGPQEHEPLHETIDR